MSIKVMAAVWESDLPATDRLVLLSLADHADDEGQCYPSVRRVCERTGLSERAVQNAFKRLSDAGYLDIEQNAGKRGTNLFVVRATPARNAPPHEMHPAPDAPHPRTKCTPTPAPDAPEPSGTVIEPSFSDSVREAVDVYNAEALRVGWPEAQKITDARRSAVRARLADVGGIEGWRFAMERAANSDFLTGKTTKPFSATFDWLTKQSNFTKLMEGNYDNRAPSGGTGRGRSGTVDAFSAVAARRAAGHGGN